MDGVGKKSDPFIVVSKANDPLKITLYRSEVIKQTLDPDFKVFEVPLTGFTNIDKDKLRFEMYAICIDIFNQGFCHCEICFGWRPEFAESSDLW